jgi:hypothetical protein
MTVEVRCPVTLAIPDQAPVRCDREWGHDCDSNHHWVIAPGLMVSTDSAESGEWIVARTHYRRLHGYGGAA